MLQNWQFFLFESIGVGYSASLFYFIYFFQDSGFKPPPFPSLRVSKCYANKYMCIFAYIFFSRLLFFLYLALSQVTIMLNSMVFSKR